MEAAIPASISRTTVPSSFGFSGAPYPFQDSAALVCHEEGKLLKLPLNRALRTEDGTVYDIISGPFFVCGLAGDSFSSLTEE